MQIFLRTLRTAYKSGAQYGIAYVNFVNKFSKNLSIGSRLYSETPKWGSKKSHRKVKLHFQLQSMADPKMEEILAPLRASVKEQVSPIWTFNFWTSMIILTNQSFSNVFTIFHLTIYPFSYFLLQYNSHQLFYNIRLV